MEITRGIVKRAYRDGTIRIVDDPDGAVCKIGTETFWFGGSEAEGVTAKEYTKNVSEEDIVDEIYDVLQECVGDKYTYFWTVLAKRKLNADNKAEFYGQLIDVFEDFLEEHAITRELMYGEDCEDVEEDAAIIYGDDYDELRNGLSEVIEDRFGIKF